ncbi:adaptor protein MecA [Weissella cibaria]|uniref:adaptor protein MecA n=1 Tax=Weissella cibaria TaxID=137591 RepID=UPI00143F5E28|nr:adaptor protein MecA [Weissella cibaria]NKN30549.1 competence protein [Weissella cibaria]NKN79437.1 competence protein [Weissella cibaria]NKN97368.1 competence protein [Weissella cibaria]NKN99724.1 competence protein [Weissella cibaria]
MEMERINEDTIRVVVTNDDLAERSISVIDLLGNQEEIERFFYNILEEVDVEHDFENNEAVTFQVLPNRNGLELFISKNIGDKAMMDGVINSMFGNRDAGDVNDDVSDSLLEQLLDNDGDGAKKKPQARQQRAAAESRAADQMVNAARELARDKQGRRQVILKFKDFEAIIQFAKMMQEEVSDSKVIEYNKDYYVELSFDESVSQAGVQDITAVAREYGDVTPVAAEVLAEHGRTIFGENGLTQVLSFFK